jgi:hypothetical protein
MLFLKFIKEILNLKEIYNTKKEINLFFLLNLWYNIKISKNSQPNSFLDYQKIFIDLLN